MRIQPTDARHSRNPCSVPPNSPAHYLTGATAIHRLETLAGSPPVLPLPFASATLRLFPNSPSPSNAQLPQPAKRSRRLSVPHPCNTGVPSQFLTHARLCYGCSWLWRWPGRRQLIFVSANKNPCSGHTCLTKFVNSYLVKRSGMRWSECTLALEAGSCVFPAVQFEIIGPWR